MFMASGEKPGDRKPRCGAKSKRLATETHCSLIVHCGLTVYGGVDYYSWTIECGAVSATTVQGRSHVRNAKERTRIMSI